MSNTLALFAGTIALLTAITLVAPRKGRHVGRTAPLTGPAPLTINYTANPYRIGAYVYVMEDSSPSEFDWAGTFIGMNNGMALVRDMDTRVVAHVNRDQLYGAQR